MTERRNPIGGIGLRSWRHQLRDDRAALLAIAIATLATSVFVASAPRVVEHASADDLRTAVAEATPEQRNLRFEWRTRLGASTQDEPFKYVRRQGELMYGLELPESVASVVSDEQWVFDSADFIVSSYPDQVEGPFPTTFRFRAQQGLDEHVALVRGRLPGAPPREFRAEGSECPEEIDDYRAFSPAPEQDCEVLELEVFETALTEQTAADMMLDVGDTVTLTPDPSDTKWLTASFPAFSHRVILRVSGIVELTDQGLEYWYADSSLHRPRITENPDFRLVFAAGLMRPDRYWQFRRAHPGVNSDYTWRYLVDPDLITGDQAEQLAIDLEKIQPSEGEFVTLLPQVLNDHLLQRTLAIQLLSMSTAGLGLVALVTIAALGLLSSVRRRASTALVVDRGASTAQMTVNSIGTGVLATLPAAFGGWLIAWRMLPSTASPTSASLAVLVGVLGVVVFVVATTPRRVRSIDADQARESRLRRWLFEGAIVGLAIVSLLLLRRRESVDLRTATGDLDLLLALTPAMLALAAGVVAGRVIGPVFSVAARLGRHTRGMGVFVGLRRLVVQPPALRFPVVVVTVAAALVTFSSVLSTSVSEAQVTASWQAVGGDVRIESTIRGVPLPLALNRAVSDSDMDSAQGARFDRRRIAGDEDVTAVDVVAVDVDAYVELLGGAGRSSGSLRKIAGGVPADEAAVDAIPPIQGIKVGEWRDSTDWAPGSTASVSFPNATREVEIVAADESMVGIVGDRATLVIDRSALARSTDERTAQPTFVLLTGGSSDASPIADVIAEEGLSARVVERADRLATVAGDPLSRWTGRALRSLAGLGLLFSLIAAAAAAVIGEAVRRRDVAVLRTLGLSSKEAGLMTVIEHVPVVVWAVLAGAAAGIATAFLLEPALGLDVFAGGSTPVVTTVDWVAIVVLAGTLAIGVSVVLTFSLRALRRSEGAKMLKVGDQ